MRISGIHKKRRFLTCLILFYSSMRFKVGVNKIAVVSKYTLQSKYSEHDSIVVH